MSTDPSLVEIARLQAERDRLHAALREAVRGWRAALADRQNARSWPELEAQFDRIHALEGCLP